MTESVAKTASSTELYEERAEVQQELQAALRRIAADQARVDRYRNRLRVLERQIVESFGNAASEREKGAPAPTEVRTAAPVHDEDTANAASEEVDRG